MPCNLVLVVLVSTHVKELYGSIGLACQASQQERHVHILTHTFFLALMKKEMRIIEE